MSTTLPKLEDEVRASAIVVAPTVMAERTRAGETDKASEFSFPAAITTWIPRPVSLKTMSAL